MKTPELLLWSRILKTTRITQSPSFAAGPVEQAHAAMRADQAVFDGHAAGSDVLPAGEILAVKKLFPFARLRREGSAPTDQQTAIGEEKRAVRTSHLDKKIWLAGEHYSLPAHV